MQYLYDFIIIVRFLWKEDKRSTLALVVLLVATVGGCAFFIVDDRAVRVVGVAVCMWLGACASDYLEQHTPEQK